MVDVTAAASPLALVLALVCLFAFVLLVLIMVGFVSLLVKRQEYLAYLRRHGQRVAASVEQIKHWSNWSTDEDGWKCDDCYQIIAVSINPEDGSKITYTSRVRKVKPRLRRGDPVIILIDPQNPTKYYMDV